VCSCFYLPGDLVMSQSLFI